MANLNQKPMPSQLLIVDDEPEQHQLLGPFLTQQGFTTRCVSDAASAIETVRDGPPDMVIMDVRMPGMSGLEALREIRELQPGLPVLLITGFTDVRDAVRAMKDGAVDYLSKPVDLDELLAAIADALGVTTQVEGEAELPPLPDDVVAASRAMHHVLSQLALVAPSDATVILTGESGTGKEVLTDVLHGWSARSDGPIVKLNCAAVPQDLLESELFGHEIGAFTGAVKTKPGRFEAAHGGTLFLDEIAEMSPALQAKLLRTLEDHSVVRVGASQPRAVDFRLVVATNQDIELAVSEGRFREDLFYRLNVIAIHVPPLHERRRDISPLALQFARHFAQDKVRVSPPAMQALEAYDWPGNVRELRNEIERACLMCRGNVILPEHLSPRLPQVDPQGVRSGWEDDDQTRLADVEKAAILRTLESCGGNRTVAAETLGISRRALIYKLKSYSTVER